MQSNEPTDLLAARLELLVLRATLTDNVEDRSLLYVLAPNETRMDASDAAKVLARMPKPCACSAERVVSDSAPVIHIRCKSVETTREMGAHRNQVGTGDDILAKAVRAAQGKPVAILMRTRFDSIVVDQAAFTAWSHGYATQATVAFLHRPPKQGVLAGVSYIVHVSGVSEPSDSALDEIPDEVLRQLPPSLRRPE